MRSVIFCLSIELNKFTINGANEINKISSLRNVIGKASILNSIVLAKLFTTKLTADTKSSGLILDED